MRYTPLIVTSGYVLSPDGQSVLLMNRNTRPNDVHYGKYIGLGGKLQDNEDVAQGIKREIQEEAGIEVDTMTLRGTISWPNWPNGNATDGSLLCFIFRIEQWQGTLIEEHREGALEWLSIADILNVPIWPGDRLFLPLVFDREIRQFHGIMPYKDGQPVSWTYTVM